MSWLLRDGEVLASLEVAESRRARARGLLGRGGIEGMLLLQPARSVHTFGMRFPIDVAHCRPERDDDRELLCVVRIVTMRTNRLGRIVWRSGAVLEAEAGCMARLGVGVGDRVEVRR